ASSMGRRPGARSPVEARQEQPEDSSKRPMDQLTVISDKLDHLSAMVASLLERQRVQEWYTTAEAAALLGKAEFTIREGCRLGRIRAEKRRSGRGAHPAWVVAHEELLRYQREGLLPLRRLA